MSIVLASKRKGGRFILGQRLTVQGKKKCVVGVPFSLLANSGQCENEDPKHKLFSQQNLVNGRHARVELRYVAGTVKGSCEARTTCSCSSGCFS